MNAAAWSPGDEGGVVGVVDRGSVASETLVDAAEALALENVLADHDCDATIVSGPLEDVLEADPSLLVTAGERTLSDLARAAVEIPVLPVGDVAGIESVPVDRLPDALDAALAGDASARARSVLGVEHRGHTRRALFDVTLVTAEPARISEYTVRSGSDPVSTFRADGVVVATPAGTHGYAGTVDAPSLSSAVDAVAVAPIAPFVTQTRRWVLPDDEVGLSVERDEGAVTLVVDDRSVETVPVDSRVTVGVDGALSTLVVPST